MSPLEKDTSWFLHFVVIKGMIQDSLPCFLGSRFTTFSLAFRCKRCIWRWCCCFYEFLKRDDVVVSQDEEEMTWDVILVAATKSKVQGQGWGRRSLPLTLQSMMSLHNVSGHVMMTVMTLMLCLKVSLSDSMAAVLKALVADQQDEERERCCIQYKTGNER